MDPIRPCSECSKESSLKCGACKEEWYCSKECQRSNWTFHKSVCKQKQAVIKLREIEKEFNQKVVTKNKDGTFKINQKNPEEDNQFIQE